MESSKVLPEHKSFALISIVALALNRVTDVRVVISEGELALVFEGLDQDFIDKVSALCTGDMEPEDATV